MDCPRCKHTQTSVIDSRDADCDAIRRRRQCDDCRFRFTTYERIEPIKWTVLKRDGSTEPYQREKLLKGLDLCTEKRDIPRDMLETIADRIETQLFAADGGQLSSEQIGQSVMKELQTLDQVAYLRFVSVYQSFANLDAFEKELDLLRSNVSLKKSLKFERNE